MKKYLLCLLATSGIMPDLFAQYYFYDAHHLEPEWRLEAGLSVGMMNCLTDLGGNKGNGKKFLADVNWGNSKPALGIYGSFTYHDWLAIRVAMEKGSVSANDSILRGKGDPASLRQKRNLSFRSSILEWSAVLEIHPLSLQQGTSPKFSPYGLVGVGYFHFRPEAFLDEAWVTLQPLHTEGQGFKEYPGRTPYRLRQGNVPVGIGAKYDLTRLMVCRVELLYRLLFTDYLDDVSKDYVDPALFYRYFQRENAELAHRLADRSSEIDPLHKTKPGAIRGNPANKDAYFTIALKLGFILNRKKL